MPGLPFWTGKQALKTQLCWQGAFSFYNLSNASFQGKGHLDGSSVCFFQNAKHRNNTLKHHFLLIGQRTIKSFLGAIRLQENKDSKQDPQLSIKKITIQLHDLRDLALDKATT